MNYCGLFAWKHLCCVSGMSALGYLLVACWVLQLQGACEEFGFHVSVSGRPGPWELINTHKSFHVPVNYCKLSAPKCH